MPRIDPYLTFQGNAQEAFNFYSKVFGNEINMVMRNKDIHQKCHRRLVKQKLIRYCISLCQ